MNPWAVTAAIVGIWCLFLVLVGLWLAWDDHDPGLAMVPEENPGQAKDQPHETASPARPPGPATTTEGRRPYLPEAASADTGSDTGPGLKVISKVIRIPWHHTGSRARNRTSIRTAVRNHYAAK